MNVARFIARRYFKAKKSRNVINLITSISVVGITIATAALVILLSAFNGIEELVIKLYSDFDPPITIRSAQSKTFNQNFINIVELGKVEGVEKVVRALEEVVILKHEKKWVHAKMIGVDPEFVEMAKIESHLVDGDPYLYVNEVPHAIFGASLLDKLDAYVPMSDINREQITFHVPLREGKIRPGKNPLSVMKIDVAARMNYNREVNSEVVIIPYELANELLKYESDITALYIDIHEGRNVNEVKKSLQEYLGDDFTVKTAYEKNELIFKTSQSERVILYFILVFVFILSSFNLMASITMLFVEKKRDISTLYSMGADKNLIFRIFFFEGLMISGRGVITGLLLGYGVCFAQIKFGLLEMPSAPGEIFPVKTTWSDAFFIILSVSALGFIISYLPTRYLVRRHQGFNK
ncbi:MAG: FtsX-like permease family protein [Brumimicrobium sp.]|nr:FtsX-like permease family protein [Brumimicrobium sp.]